MPDNSTASGPTTERGQFQTPVCVYDRAHLRHNDGVSGYRIVRLVNGSHSVHSLAEGETFHPVVGPSAEAEALYVRQLDLARRAQSAALAGEEFVVWDIGLGAAANPVTFLRAIEGTPCRVRIVSFDHTLEPLRFALGNVGHLPYLEGFTDPLRELAERREARFESGGATVNWSVFESDFPSLLRGAAAEGWPKPHAIMFDAFSPAKNPVMWTQPVFGRIFQLLDPARPCALPTYSRSTLLRVTLLISGFFVGVGHPTGEKEETTVAANSMSLINEPLNPRWLERARRSHSAEPLWEPRYQQAPLSQQTWGRLRGHPQFHARPNA